MIRLKEGKNKRSILDEGFMFIIETNTTDPAVNLAFEEYYLRHAAFDDPILMLWRNEPTVVVGAFQNTYSEVDYDYLRSHNIHLVRRTTGGGAVYHDLGNLCYSFIRLETDLEHLDFHQFLQPVQTALATLGIDAEISGRNDLLVDGRKISGSAARVAGDRVLFHGTLLYSSDLDVLSRVLTVKKEKIVSKGVPSVRSRVTRIADHLPHSLDILEFKQLLLNAFLDPETHSPYEPSEREKQAILALADSKYRNDEWTLGKNPSFNVSYSHRFDKGELTVKLLVHHSRIEHCHFEGDYLGWLDSDEVASALVGVVYSRESVEAVMKRFEESSAGSMSSLDLYFGGLTRNGIVGTIMGEHKQQGE